MFLELRPRGVLFAAQSADANLPMTHGCDFMLLSAKESPGEIFNTSSPAFKWDRACERD
jgi:hypothetical protein